MTNQNEDTTGAEKPVEDETPAEAPASDQADGAGAVEDGDTDESK